MDDMTTGDAAEESVDFRVEVSFHELEIVAYIGELKIVGTAHFGRSGRVASQRSSDYLRHFTDTRLTLSEVRIYRHATNEVLDTVPFIILNLDRADLVYAREIGEQGKGDSAMREGVIVPVVKPAGKPATKPTGKPTGKPAGKPTK